MKTSMFKYPSFQYELDDWEFRKKGLLKRINKQEFIRTELQTFNTDRSTNSKTYVRYLEDFLRPTLQEFCEEAKVTCSISDAWCVKYDKGDYQGPHNHRGWGYTGVLFVEFDPRVHGGTVYIAPWQDPSTDTTTLIQPQVKEGSLVIVPSYTLHYAPPNTSSKRRTILSFDLLPKCPAHQSINN